MKKLFLATMFILALFSCQKEQIEPTCDQFQQCHVTWTTADKIFYQDGFVVSVNKRAETTPLEVPTCDNLTVEDFLRQSFLNASDAERNFHERWNEMIFATDESGNTIVVSWGKVQFEC